MKRTGQGCKICTAIQQLNRLTMEHVSSYFRHYFDVQHKARGSPLTMVSNSLALTNSKVTYTCFWSMVMTAWTALHA